MPSADLPIVDLDEPNSHAALHRGLRETGFFYLRDHAVPPELLARIREETVHFFSLPVEQKQACRDNLRGYAALREEDTEAGFGTGEAGEGDLCEKFTMGTPVSPRERAAAPEYYEPEPAQRFFLENVFPSPDFAATWHEYFTAMARVSARLMQGVRSALGEPPEAWAPVLDKPANTMRFLNYPEVASSSARMAAHYDDNLLTLLHQSRTANGFNSLQVMLPGETDWRDVPANDDFLVVNVGDALMYLTGGRVVATKHRVAPVPPEKREGSARTSIAFFHIPNWNCPLRPALPPGLDQEIGQANATFGLESLCDPDGTIPYYRLQDRAVARAGMARVETKDGTPPKSDQE